MKRIGLIGLLVAILANGTLAVQAQDKFPSKPIQVMVPFAAGSATDITIRSSASRCGRDRPRLRGREQARRVRDPRHRGNGQGRRPTATRSRSATPAPTL